MQFADLIGAVKPPERVVTLITSGDLLGEHAAALAEFEAAGAKPATSLDGSSEVRAAAARLREIEGRLAESTVDIRVRGIGRNAFTRLLAEHPSESGPWDRDTFPVALVAACVVDPTMTEEQAGELAGILTDAQWDALFEAAWACCREVDEVPFTALASVLAQS